MSHNFRITFDFFNSMKQNLHERPCEITFHRVFFFNLYFLFHFPSTTTTSSCSSSKTNENFALICFNIFPPFPRRFRTFFSTFIHSNRFSKTHSTQKQLCCTYSITAELLRPARLRIRSQSRFFPTYIDSRFFSLTHSRNPFSAETKTNGLFTRLHRHQQVLQWPKTFFPTFPWTIKFHCWLVG